jgi:MFS family permease
MTPFNLRRTLLMAILGSVSLMPLLVLPIVVGGFVDFLTFTESEAGYLASAGFLGSAVAAIVISLRIHHLDLRRLAWMGITVLILCDAMSIFAAELDTWVFVAVRFLSGAGGATAYAAVMGAYAGWKQPERAYGLFMSMQFLFSALGLFGLPWVLDQRGVEGVFMLFTALDVLALAFVAQVPGRRERVPESGGSGLEWRVIVTPVALFCLLGIGLFEAANMASFTYSERIGLQFSLDSAEIGTILGAATVLGIPAAFGVFLLGARFGRYIPIMLTGLTQSIALVLLLTGSSPSTYVISMCLMSLGWAFALPYFQAIEARIDPRGSVVVAGGFATSLGDFLGPATAASLVRPGHYSDMIIGTLMAYAVVILLIRLVQMKMRSSADLPDDRVEI